MCLYWWEFSLISYRPCRLPLKLYHLIIHYIYIIYLILCLACLFDFYLFILIERTWVEEEQREREREWESQTGSVLSAQSLMPGSIPRTLRSWPEPKSRVECFKPLLLFPLPKGIFYNWIHIKSFIQLGILCMSEHHQKRLTYNNLNQCQFTVLPISTKRKKKSQINVTHSYELFSVVWAKRDKY